MRQTAHLACTHTDLHAQKVPPLANENAAGKPGEPDVGQERSVVSVLVGVDLWVCVGVVGEKGRPVMPERLGLA